MTYPINGNRGRGGLSIRQFVLHIKDWLTAALSGKQDTLEFDDAPTAGSTNPVTSGGVKTALGSYATKANAITGLSASGTTVTYTKGDGTNGTITTQDTDTKYSVFGKSGSTAATGLVPKPSTTAGTTKYLREDGTWQVPPDNNTTYSVMTAATESSAGTSGLVPAPAAGKQGQYLRGDGTWHTPANTSPGSGGTATFATKKGTAPGSNQYHEHISYDNSGNGSGAAYRFALVGRYLTTGNQSGAYLTAYDPTSGQTRSATIGVYYPAGGTAYTQAPTPAQTDDSTKIATTAYVKDCVPKSIGAAKTPVYSNANGVITAGTALSDFAYKGMCTTAAGTSSTASASKPAVVTANYKSGHNWYRVWSDGFIEQGGRVGSSGSGGTSVTLLKAFADTNYTVTLANNSTNYGDYGGAVSITSKSAMKIYNSNNRAYYWEAKGY